MKKTTTTIEQLQTRIEALEAQIKENEAAQTRLDRTISSISHDLKTPLTGIKLFADILMSPAEGDDNETHGRYLAAISAEAERMSRMISNIVDLQRLSSGEVEWHDQENDIVRLIANCSRPFKALSAAKGVGFSYESDIESLALMIDADRFMRLISGLLANALRFTEAGAVKVELRHDDARACIAVTDNGPGISEEHQELLSRPCPSQTALGKDIGFSFARAVVDHYHGQLRAENVAGKGATVYVELPR